MTMFTRTRTPMSVEAALLSVTKGVLNWLPQATFPLGWLQVLVFRLALRRAYHRFARCYPQWVDFFFDEHFLRHRAAPLLARFLQQVPPPSPAELATAWEAQIGPASSLIRQQRIAQLTPAAADFLAWLEAELRPQPMLRPESSPTTQLGHAGTE